MKSVKLRIVFLFFLFLCMQVNGQELDIDDELSKLTPFFQALRNFSNTIPQEKVYLHFDNTSYYQSDNIWFKCYVTSGQHQLSELSKTLYVELLNPGGETIAKRILKIENGQCHGDFSLNHLPFYSGFYEVRAYTKYMLNFGDDVIFSRLLPVFNKPKVEGDFEEKEMLSYGSAASGRPMKRKSPERGKAVNVRFFPEGGNLIQGVTSQIAFEATDAFGNPIDVTGVVLDGAKQEICQFASVHEGRGVFSYTPDNNRRRSIAVVAYSGRTYQFDMPAGLPQGVVMEVDNLSHTDSIGIILRKNSNTPADLYGVAILLGGNLQNYCAAWLTDDEIHFQMDKKRLPSGVSQIVLFNRMGEIVCDRLVFTHKNNGVDIKVKTDRPFYQSYEPVDIEISVADRSGNPVHTTFSLSVRDGENEVENNHSILTDLLLMSEIKGYVRNPAYYFEEKNDAIGTRHATSLLDLLLMVQGWRRYSWKQMVGIEPFDLKHFPEQGIETHGTILAVPLIGRNLKPRPNVDVSLLLHKEADNDDGDVSSMIETFVTDNQGRFAFVSDVEGKWNMILSAKENGKAKNHQIVMDRVFSPEPGRYRYADLQVNIAENNPVFDDDVEEVPEEDPDLFFIAGQDSLSKLGIDEKVYQLEEVTVTAKRRTREQDIYRNRSTSVAYYDVASEYDNIYDRGNVFIGNNIHQILMNMNQDFSIERQGTYEFLYYKNRMILFVVNYEKTTWNELGYFMYKTIRVPAIKSIYINENTSVIAQYINPPNPGSSPMGIALRLSCAVLIETYPEGEIHVEGAKGVRKTWLEGYSAASEFYSPNYSVLPPMPDYRRTLYWNPMVVSGENGVANIQFYNNSNSKNFKISAETITSQGMIGMFTHE